MLGLALGGGGARGSAHLGVLKHFEEIKVRPDCIAGTSAGAIIASLYAFEIPTKIIHEEIKKLKPATATGLRFGELGLVENVSLRKMLESLLGKDCKIEDAKIPLAIHVTNCETGIGENLTQGSVIDAVMASSCVPGLYVPPLIDNKIYVDGGLTENVPFSALKALGANKTIGINLNGMMSYERPEGALDVISNALDIAIDSQTKKQLEKFDDVLNIDLRGFSRTSASQAEALIEKGYAAAKSHFPNRSHIRWLKLKKIWHTLTH
ncbi:MAG: patatin-like phospholipase family protein [Bdellovibrionia bacterium]